MAIASHSRDDDDDDDDDDADDDDDDDDDDEQGSELAPCAEHELGAATACDWCRR